MSKAKSNSIIDGLPQNQRDQVEAWLFEENISYKDASARMLADFGVSCATSSLSEWRKRREQVRMLDRIAASRDTANLVVKKFAEKPADMYQVLLDMVGQIAFDKAFQDKEGLDAETIFNFTKLVMAGKKQNMEAERLALDRDKFELMASEKLLDKALRAKADEINSSNLSHADKIAAMRREAFKSVDELQKSGSVKIPK